MTLKTVTFKERKGSKNSGRKPLWDYRNLKVGEGFKVGAKGNSAVTAARIWAKSQNNGWKFSLGVNVADNKFWVKRVK